MSSSSEQLDDRANISFVDFVDSLRIPIEEIKLATNNFTDANLLPIQSPSSSSFRKLIYKGKLEQSGIDIVARIVLEEQDNIVFNELVTSYLLTHKNILPIFKISSTDEPILINKYEANESLDKHLCDSNLTWMQILHICVGVAHALSYIHDYDADGDFSVKHGNIKSSKILLDENWEPKLNCFGFSMFVKKYQPHLASKYSGTLQYTDPAYDVNTGCLTRKSDVFSFGVVLFEVLFGEIASVKDEDNQYFAKFARSIYEEKRLDDIIDAALHQQMDPPSLEIFSEAAYVCLKEVPSERPDMVHIVEKLEASLKLQQDHEILMNSKSNTNVAPMKVNIIADHAPTAPVTKPRKLWRSPLSSGRQLTMPSFMTEFEHLEMQLEVIKSATDNFDGSKIIGRGSFGTVYKGELSRSQSGEKILVAIRRLDRRYGQSDPEFFKEIMMLLRYRHENLISLLGFCCQEGEMILIYEYASRGSLDRLLGSADLTWMQRLSICIDAAMGLRFLHDPKGTEQRVLHHDIKSANILLDKNMTAKVSDFGLSNMSPANQTYSLIINSVIIGTPGYCDPLYMEMGYLTIESDVYSFGIVLFEVLCGRQCFENINGQFKDNVPFWRKSYEENKLDEIILPDLREQMDPSSLKTFSTLAFQCTQKSREERPTMSFVVEKLKEALDHSHESSDLGRKLLTGPALALGEVSDGPGHQEKKERKENEKSSLEKIAGHGRRWLSWSRWRR